jgi:hypothetical protein
VDTLHLNLRGEPFRTVWLVRMPGTRTLDGFLIHYVKAYVYLLLQCYLAFLSAE